MNRQYYKNKIAEYISKRPIGGYAYYLQKKYKDYKYICVFGVGNMGLDLPSKLEKYDIKVDFFCDNNQDKVGKMFQGTLCISVEELCAYKEDVVVLIATRYYKEIYGQLKKLGFNHMDRILDNKFAVDSYLKEENEDDIKNKLYQVIEFMYDEQSAIVLTRLIQEWCRNEYEYGQIDDICSTNQYFDNSVVRLLQEEIFVDCGAYIGDTLDDFLIETNKKFKKAFLFELSAKNHKILVDRVKSFYPQLGHKVCAVNAGVAKKTEKIYYKESDEGSGIAEDGDTIGEVVSLDDYFKKKEVTFIKMDIEGAEKEALEGAKKLIQRCQPKLAVCLYHKPQDLWELPLLMKQICPNYRLYMRHYTDLLNETVCYAII